MHAKKDLEGHGNPLFVFCVHSVLSSGHIFCCCCSDGEDVWKLRLFVNDRLAAVAGRLNSTVSSLVVISSVAYHFWRTQRCGGI